MLLAGITATAWMWREESRTADERAMEQARERARQFLANANTFRDQVVTASCGLRMLLRGRPDLTSAEWIGACRGMPGNHCYGFVEVARVKGADRARFLEEAIWRARDDYAIRPMGERSEFRPVLLHFPDTEGHLSGLDLATVPAAAKALEDAIESGWARTSLPFTLPEDPSRRVFLLTCLPIAAPGAAASTAEERRVSTTGWVASLALAADLVDQSYPWSEPFSLTALDVHVKPIELASGSASALPSDTVSLPVGEWTLRIPRPRVERSWRAPGIAAVATCLLFLLVWSVGALPRLAAQRAEADTRPLREQLERIRGVLDSALDGILTIDDTGVVLSANAAAERIFGHLPGELARKRLAELLSEECREEYSPGLGTRFRVGHNDIVGRVVEISGLRKDASRIPIDLSIWEVRVLGKRVFTGIVRDITERKLAQDALHEARYRLERALDELKAVQRELVQQERLRALGEMASGITHDFNNFLSPIAGFAEMLLSVPGALEDREKSRRYLELIHTSARAAAGVVARLREFYRRREGTDARTPIDMNRLAKEVIELTEPKWKGMTLARGIEVRAEVRTGATSCVICGNEAEIRNVLTNLVFNAVDAMPRGGALALSCEKQGDRAVIEVSDTGVGMSPDVMKRCLEPFYTTKGERGTGLGLSVAVGTVERHGGSLEIESEEGNGTTVRLRFPLDADPTPTQSQPREEPRARSIRVLVAEDDEMIRVMLSGYLSVAGHEVVLARDGKEAMERFRTESCGLVVTDMAMPEMSGTQLAAEIRRSGSKVPVILLSGLAEQMRAEEADLHGIDLVLGKPVSLAALTQAVATLSAKG